MAEFVVSVAVETIEKLLIDEAKPLWGVNGQVKDLQKELKLIQVLLRDADARREHDQVVGFWVAQLQDIAYDVEDFIEQYNLRAARENDNIIKANACFVAMRTRMQVHAVRRVIELLKSSISNLRTSMQAYGIQPVNQGERKHRGASTSRRTYDHFKEDFVGRGDSIKELVEELLNDRKKRRVISIWGMGGLGKTSLAKKVIAHDKVKNTFDGVAWACVSQEYHVKDILVGILVKLVDPDQRQEVKEMIDDELFKALYDIQQKKRCIVVLDDIWTIEAWNCLQAAFPIENTRTKLLITTRNREVAEYIDPHGFLHELRCLSNRESWDLLKKRASLETEVVPEDMKRLGDELLNMCGGLPLAVKVLGGLLVTNEWENIYRNINPYFGGDDDVSKVLALSYDDLAWYLKPCFLYLGSFRTNEIPARKFIHMLIAERFVLPSAHDEDVAEQYLVELANRGMVELQFTLSGKIKTCRLCNLMRDLCVSKARQEIFLKIQPADETEDSSSSSSSSSSAMAIVLEM